MDIVTVIDLTNIVNVKKFQRERNVRGFERVKINFCAVLNVSR